ADDMVINKGINASNGMGSTGIVTLQQAGTTTRAIDLGLGTTAGDLGLSDTELGQVTASILRIGRTDNAGNLSITGQITVHAGFDTLSLRSGGAILDANLSEPDIAVSNLALHAAAGIADGGLLDLDVVTVAALNTTSGSIGLDENGGVHANL